MAARVYGVGGLVVDGVLRDEFRIDGTLVSDVLMARHLFPPG